ncbi:hypothetical protein SSOG_03628 [Streptomyces himastatinicus ATCC 53653]|uniref:Uncharacterized protein n=1 Tax=Streptomyces himastatinicus ATCC 53653 TaxID=457427 RepID=D9WPR0_9ACTN|nr:hypothetical protein SSOG_03628 [Streptomyces himastatinicus ATCC 53653]
MASAPQRPAQRRIAAVTVDATPLPGRSTTTSHPLESTPQDGPPGASVSGSGGGVVVSAACRGLSVSEDGLGFGYPLRIAGEWGLRHTDGP